MLAASADGYTLMYTAQNTVAINPSVYRNLPYKVDDFMPVSHITTVPPVLIVAANSPIKSFADLIQAAKASPGKLNFASYGVGQGTHVAMVRMLNAAGVTMTHMPYQNGGIFDVMSGAVDVSFDASTAAIPQITGGKLRALAVSSTKRNESLPDAPTVAEVLPGFNGDSWQGVLVRTGTPPDIIAKRGRSRRKSSTAKTSVKSCATLASCPRAARRPSSSSSSARTRGPGPRWSRTTTSRSNKCQRRGPVSRRRRVGALAAVDLLRGHRHLLYDAEAHFRASLRRGSARPEGRRQHRLDSAARRHETVHGQNGPGQLQH